MPSWPATLPPSPLMAGFRVAGPKLGIRTENDAGPANQRRRFTAAAQRFGFAMACTKAQFVIFEAFFANDLAGGVLPFDYAHPITGLTRKFRFVVGEEYEAVPDDDPGWYVVTAPIELLPG